ncbi:MAG: DUF3786 domain-containing protein [Proteobacteria bacterium]|nr:DUF3786 domain-containing protein [Pseudomonadota bacterium]MBU1711683.1 DUF3786 domain-containing protein [Pseudomonadota bacterium]
MTYSIDISYFKELAGKNPEDICRIALCDYDIKIKAYILTVWGEDYGIYPDECKIAPLRNRKSDLNTLFGLFIIYYLLKSKDIKVSGEWISEKDIPGGTTFFRGPHKIPTQLIERQYEEDLTGFKDICEQLSGSRIDMADAAYSFQITPRVPAAVLFWEGDDEFQPESKILFDKTITEHLTPDIIFCLAVEICQRISGIKE